MGKQVINFKDSVRPVHAWVGHKDSGLSDNDDPIAGPDIEDTALEQLRNLSTLRFIHPHGVVCMPDVHAGYGSTVGSVIATMDKVIPAAVGVDIGCGMCAVRTSLTAEDLPESLAVVRKAIEDVVPTGKMQNLHTSGQEHTVPLDLQDRFKRVLVDAPDLAREPWVKMVCQFGSLGGGNHFIEVCLDESGAVWIMLHSGSRGVGNAIGVRYIDTAVERMAQYGIVLADEQLAFLVHGTKDFADYMNAVLWAQDYARENRNEMMARVWEAVERGIGKKFEASLHAINCHHNYVELENHYGKNVYVTRKGAIRARLSDYGIIPGSMGTRSYIVKGKQNNASYHSCSHGAGRRMSRGMARKTFNQDNLIEQTLGVECRKDVGILDEIPGAYKDIDRVMAQQEDLVTVLHTLKAVLCVKGE